MRRIFEGKHTDLAVILGVSLGNLISYKISNSYMTSYENFAFLLTEEIARKKLKEKFEKKVKKIWFEVVSAKIDENINENIKGDWPAPFTIKPF